MKKSIHLIPGKKNRQALSRYPKYELDTLLHTKLKMALALNLAVDHISAIINHHLIGNLYAHGEYNSSLIEQNTAWLARYCSEVRMISMIKNMNPFDLEGFILLGQVSMLVDKIHHPALIERRIHRRVRTLHQLLSTLVYLIELDPSESFELKKQKEFAQLIQSAVVDGYEVEVPTSWSRFQEISHEVLNCLGGKNIKKELLELKTYFLVLKKDHKIQWVLSLDLDFKVLACKGFLNTNPSSDKLNKIITAWQKYIDSLIEKS